MSQDTRTLVPGKGFVRVRRRDGFWCVSVLTLDGKPYGDAQGRPIVLFPDHCQTSICAFSYGLEAILTM